MDKENDQIVQTLVGLGEAKNWLIFDSLIGIFNVDPELIQPGEFPVKITIVDSLGSVADYSFTIFVDSADPIAEEP